MVRHLLESAKGIVFFSKLICAMLLEAIINYLIYSSLSELAGLINAALMA